MKILLIFRCEDCGDEIVPPPDMKSVELRRMEHSIDNNPLGVYHIFQAILRTKYCAFCKEPR